MIFGGLTPMPIIYTRNSVYTLKDMGDGGFLMTSTNPTYAGPVMVKLEEPPTPNVSVYMRFLEGRRKGRHLITSRVVRVEAEG